MSRRRIVIAEPAAAHLGADIGYLEEKASLAVALKFQDTVARELAQLSEFPEIGSPHAITKHRLKALRMRPIEGFSNWLIF